MSDDLAIELVAEHHLFRRPGGGPSIARPARAPDTRLAHKAETRLVDHSGPISLNFGAEEERGPEDPLERSDKSAVLRAALMHAECLSSSAALGNTIV